MDEAFREFKQALEIDPFSTIIIVNYGFALGVAHRHQEELEQYHKALEINPNSYAAHAYLGGYYYTCRDEYQAAAQEIEKSDPRLKGLIDGSSREALLRSEIRAQTEITHIAATKPNYIGSLYARLGDKDRAFEWLEKAYHEQDLLMATFIRGCKFDDIRSDPRYADLMRRQSLPP